jgi:hypothetical protein
VVESQAEFDKWVSEQSPIPEEQEEPTGSPES